MTFVDSLYNNKNLIGKVLFFISILFLISLVIVSLNGVYIFIDERFSLYLIQLPLAKAIPLCIKDVHPPLYYIIIKIPCAILSALSIPYNPIVVSRLASIFPYLIILIVSATKLRKEYGWFIAGLFAFAIGAMSGFYIFFLTIRMYNWGLLFLVLSYIYLKDVISKKDKKSWILFTLFTVGCGYTQYILLISSGILYLGLMAHYLIHKEHEEIKKWVASAAGVVLFYLPWILIFMGQLTKESGKKSLILPAFTEMINDFSGYMFRTPAMDAGFLILKIIAIFVVLYIIRWSIAKYLVNNNDCNSHQFIGILTPILTIIALIIGFMMVGRDLSIRYLVPVFSITWLAISIFMGTFNKKRAFAILLLAILVLGCINVIDTANEVHRDITRGYEEQSILNDINNDNSIVVYSHRFPYTMYSNDLNNAESYTTTTARELPYEYDVTGTDLTDKEVENLINDNPDKHVYELGKIKDKPKSDILFSRGSFGITQLS